MFYTKQQFCFESGGYKMVDKIITVFADKVTKINRVIKRDGVSIEEVEQRMSKQMDDQEKIDRSDFVIDNNGDQTLISQILNIHKRN